jgi:hypothetical protein
MGKMARKEWVFTASWSNHFPENETTRDSRLIAREWGEYPIDAFTSGACLALVKMGKKAGEEYAFIATWSNVVSVV